MGSRFEDETKGKEADRGRKRSDAGAKPFLISIELLRRPMDLERNSGVTTWAGGGGGIENASFDGD